MKSRIKIGLMILSCYLLSSCKNNCDSFVGNWKSASNDSYVIQINKVSKYYDVKHIEKTFFGGMNDGGTCNCEDGLLKSEVGGQLITMQGNNLIYNGETYTR